MAPSERQSVLQIALLEPYAARSHRSFARGLGAHSRHRLETLSLPARAWKWRMRTAAIHYARELTRRPPFDVVLVSDYVNLAELLALLPSSHRRPAFLGYFHENQLTYPLQEGEARDHHFALTHLYSLLSAEFSWFNSCYHRDTFLEALANLLTHVPDVEVRASLEDVRRRSAVLPLGTDVRKGRLRQSEVPTILWNHRWEYDKDPGTFVRTLEELAPVEDFRVLLLGERFREIPPELDRLRQKLGDRVETNAFVEDEAAYRALLARAHITVSTARHEFFGLGTLEALRSGALPVLPADLAYPELLPDDEALRRSYLYPRKEGPAACLRRALAQVRGHGDLVARQRILDGTDAFTWDEVAARFDAAFEAFAERSRRTPGARREEVS